MMSPMSPEMVYMVYKQREKELLREIELIRQAKEAARSQAPAQPWSARFGQWLNEKVIHRTAEVPVADRPANAEEACAGC